MIDIKDIKKLYQIFINNDIEKVEIQNGEDRLSLTIGSQVNSIQNKVKVSERNNKDIQVKEIQLDEKDELFKKEENETLKIEVFELKSKWIGFFTRMSPQTGESYIKLRDVVKKDQILGNVRVLGVLQDLKSEVEGKVKEILVEEGQPIEYGQPVMRFEL